VRTKATIAAVLTALILLVAAGPAGAITRAEIVARGQHWVDLEVPYSQASYFEGYRQDCSGMASMTWKLDRSYSTRTLAPNGTPIRRDQLQPGDMLLKYDYHAAIFYKWADAEHTRYWTLEQSGGTGHAVSRLTPYPFWGHTGFTAYRPNHVEEIDDWGPYLLEVAGADRYATAIAASELAFESLSTSAAVVCSGEDWPDALGGSALAGALGGPVLLTGRDRVPSGLSDELDRLGASRVVIIGGEGAVSATVASEIEALAGVSVERIGGVDRYETAALVASAVLDELAAKGRSFDGTAYVATGEAFADALGAATVAAHAGRPVFLSQASRLTTSTADALASLAVARVVVAGGEASLSASVTAGIDSAGVGEIERLAGVDRYETSRLLAMHGVEEGLVWGDVALATGQGFADALAGAVAQARRGSVLVLTPSDRLVPSADWAVREHLDRVEVVTVYGGDAAVDPLVRRLVRWIMDEP
jgi:putative cell wall-binding protein